MSDAPEGGRRTMPYRSECRCECHSRPGMVHIAPCCDPDPVGVVNSHPEGVESVMYLRDGWPDCVVCKVKMADGRVGVGLSRFWFKVTPEQGDEYAFHNAMRNLSSEPPDYTELHEYLAKMKAMETTDG